MFIVFQLQSSTEVCGSGSGSFGKSPDLLYKFIVVHIVTSFGGDLDHIIHFEVQLCFVDILISQKCLRSAVSLIKVPLIHNKNLWNSRKIIIYFSNPFIPEKKLSSPSPNPSPPMPNPILKNKANPIKSYSSS